MTSIFEDREVVLRGTSSRGSKSRRDDAKFLDGGVTPSGTRTSKPRPWGNSNPGIFKVGAPDIQPPNRISAVKIVDIGSRSLTIGMAMCRSR